jgi:hypothetical protein
MDVESERTPDSAMSVVTDRITLESKEDGAAFRCRKWQLGIGLHPFDPILLPQQRGKGILPRPTTKQAAIMVGWSLRSICGRV